MLFSLTHPIPPPPGLMYLVCDADYSCDTTNDISGPAVLCGMLIFILHHGICHLPQNLLLAAEKRNCPFFATFISNSWFFRLISNFTIYKTVKYNHHKLTFMFMKGCA